MIDKSKEFNIPTFNLIFCMKFILKELEEKADAVVGWNSHCIVYAIKTIVNRENWLKPYDIGESE